MNREAPTDHLAPQPLTRARALHASFYTGGDTLSLERAAVFAPSWQLVGHVSRLAAPGDHVVAEAAGVPLVAVRDGDGVLRCFHNVCRHRAGPIATCDGRGARALICQYHGWAYRLDGSLRGAPEMGDAEDFDPGSIRLPEVRVDAWQGLVFAALDDRAPPLRELLEVMSERVGERGMDGYDFDRRVSYDTACNWKVYVDNFLEGYHLPHVHPALNKALDYRSYVTETAHWHSLQWSPLESGDTPYGTGDALYYFVWPNTMLNILPDRLQTNRVVPLGPDRCRVDFDYYYPAAVPAADRDADVAFSERVQREDMDICEAVQHRLASGSYEAGRLNPKREAGVHHFHELYRRALRDRA